MPAVRKSEDRPAPARTSDEDPLMVATQSFSADVGGSPVAVHEGSTLVRSTHELVKRYPEYFVRADTRRPTFETATRRAGEKRGEQE
jgi:hypothetical protein